MSICEFSSYPKLQQLWLAPDQFEPPHPDCRRPGSPVVVLVQVEDDLLPGRAAVPRDAAPHVHGIKACRQKRLEPSNGKERVEPVTDKHHSIVLVARATEERAVNPPHPPNSSLVERLLAIPERKVGRLVRRSSVVRAEDDHRVLVDAGGFEGVHHLEKA